ncbi:anthranilate/para-aminobenzoate synthase component I [Pseudomonas psychrotolerans]|nr:anthranilate/para-aminobenzoate synthase component I [Pseudomonas psychrotolerans]
MPLCHLHPLPYHAEPTARFALLHGEPGAVLLDSGRPVAERGRYDLMAAWPLAVLKPAAGEDGRAFFARARAALVKLGQAELPDEVELPFAGGLLGYLGYDFGRRLERLPEGARADLQLPDARLGLYAWALISDHQARTSQLVCHPALDAGERQRLIALFEAEATPETS